MLFMNKEAMNGGKAGPCFRKGPSWSLPGDNLNPTPCKSLMLFSHIFNSIAFTT